MKVPLLDLKAQYDTIADEMKSAVDRVLESQQFVNGPEVGELEEKFARFCNCQYAVGVSSGTDALLLSLMALGVGPGDEVITTPYTFFATAGSIWRTGARPVFVDISPDTFNLDPAKIEAAVSDRTKAIIPVHLFGQCADMHEIATISEKYNLFVIEDACQSIGAVYRGKTAGSMGTAGCFSFFPSKNLGGLGDGGMITSQDGELTAKLRALRNHGGSRQYYHDWVGGNFRLDTIQAAGLLVKFKYLSSWTAKRRANAALYEELFKDMDAVVTPAVDADKETVVNQYVIRVPDRDGLREYLKENEIGHSVYYPLSLHQQPCFSTLGYQQGDFPESEQAACETLALPIYPELTNAMIEYVAETVKAYYR